MAHLLRSYPNTSTKLCTQPYSHAYTLFKPSSKELRFGYLEKGRNFLAQSFSNNSCSTEEVGNFVDKSGRSNGDNFEYLASDFGWKVRRLSKIGDEIRSAARVQAEAFHEPALLFNDFFFEFFQAEVLAGLMYKLRNSHPNGYACLVAVPETEASNTTQQLVGVVDVTALRDQNVLKNLPPDADEYLYISGIAVLENFRRRKIASVLLKACDMLAILWGFKYLVLRAYEDDFGARELYSNAGYRVVSGDPPWLTTWVGRKRRVLMIKHSRLPSMGTNSQQSLSKKMSGTVNFTRENTVVKTIETLIAKQGLKVLRSPSQTANLCPLVQLILLISFIFNFFFLS